MLKHSLIILFTLLCVTASCKKSNKSEGHKSGSEQPKDNQITDANGVMLINPDDADIEDAVLWDGDAAKGFAATMLLANYDPAGVGSITTVTDPVYGYKFVFDKPAESRRVEAHGVKGFRAAEGQTIYIGWVSKVTLPANETCNAFFQWKAYGSGMMQNYPLVIKSLAGELVFEQYNPGENGKNVRNTVWKTPIVTDQWHSYVIKIHVTKDVTKGYIEFWYNGKQQTLSNGTKRFYCRTLDAEYCDPKWGVYGAKNVYMKNEVARLKIGTTYKSVKP